MVPLHFSQGKSYNLVESSNLVSKWKVVWYCAQSWAVSNWFAYAIGLMTRDRPFEPSNPQNNATRKSKLQIPRLCEEVTGVGRTPSSLYQLTKEKREQLFSSLKIIDVLEESKECLLLPMNAPCLPKCSSASKQVKLMDHCMASRPPFSKRDGRCERSPMPAKES